MTPESVAARSRAYRDRRRGGPPRELQPCGTRSAYKRHLRRGEPVDDACRAANTEYHRQVRTRTGDPTT